MCSNSRVLDTGLINTTNGAYEHARQVFSNAIFILSMLLPLLRFISLFDSLLTLFTRHFHSLNSLFPLLVFVFTSHSHASCSYSLSCFLPTLFNRPLAFFFFIACFLPHSSYYTIRGRCEGRDSRGWSKHTCEHVYKLVGHTLMHVTLPVTCTVKAYQLTECES